MKRKFTNWVEMSEDDLRTEYLVEVVKKGLDHLFGSFEEFRRLYKKAKVVEVTPEMDRNIGYRSRTKSKEALLSLIKTYRSYPKYRNEKTLDAIYQGFKNNAKMKMPIVIKFPDGRLRVLGGNTRMDVAFQLGINPKVKLIDLSKEKL